MVRFTPNGLSVMPRQRAISRVRSSGVGWVSAVMKPSAPALATAATSSARPTHCMPPCTIGCSTPTSSVNRVLIIAALGFPGADVRAHSFWRFRGSGCRHPPQMSTGDAGGQSSSIMQKRGFCFRGADNSAFAAERNEVDCLVGKASRSVVTCSCRPEFSAVALDRHSPQGAIAIVNLFLKLKPFLKLKSGCLLPIVLDSERYRSWNLVSAFGLDCSGKGLL